MYSIFTWGAHDWLRVAFGDRVKEGREQFGSFRVFGRSRIVERYSSLFVVVKGNVVHVDFFDLFGAGTKSVVSRMSFREHRTVVGRI